jgi:glycosyltransferase involved in cell wall biosynthesis
MNILILYAEIMPYNIPVFNEMVRNGYNVYIIQLDRNKLTPYKHDKTNGVSVKNISEFKNYFEFKNYCKELNPVLIMISEVMEKWYWKFAIYYHRHHKKFPIVLGSDAQWTGSLHNWMKKYLYIFSYKRCFTHVLSAGLWQCVYALKIGFKRNQIITPLYCANNELYNNVDIEHKKIKYPKNFLFIGRLVEVKGIKNILDAWDSIKDKKGWTLTMIGNGIMADEIKNHKDILLKPFMSQEEICSIMENSGCALIPSLYEPWGLVIHEASAAGLPIIASKNCGAVSEFLVNGYNGFTIDPNSADSLSQAMRCMIDLDSCILIDMSKNSRRLSYRIVPSDVSSALISLIK